MWAELGESMVQLLFLGLVRWMSHFVWFVGGMELGLELAEGWCLAWGSMLQRLEEQKRWPLGWSICWWLLLC